MSAMRLVLLMTLTTVATCVAPATVLGQAASTRVSSSVTVVSPPILLTNLRNLEFGSVGPGQVIDVPALGPHPSGTVSAGMRFGDLRKQRTYGLTLTLPASLVRGTSSIPVSWNGTQYGSLCSWSSSPSECNALSIAFSPDAHTTVPLPVSFPINTPSNNFSADIYIGGRLSVPTYLVAPGVYQGTITATLTVIS
jgi:spore coat protein U-like protein